MASVETIIRKDRVAYRGIPWIVLPNGRRKKGPTKTYDSESAAMSYAVSIEGGSDGDIEAFGLSVTRNRKRVLFSEYTGIVHPLAARRFASLVISPLVSRARLSPAPFRTRVVNVEVASDERNRRRRVHRPNSCNGQELGRWIRFERDYAAYRYLSQVSDMLIRALTCGKRPKRERTAVRAKHEAVWVAPWGWPATPSRSTAPVPLARTGNAL